MFGVCVMSTLYVLGYYTDRDSSRLDADVSHRSFRKRRIVADNIRIHIWSLITFVLLLGFVIGMLVDSVSASAASPSDEGVSHGLADTVAASISGRSEIVSEMAPSTHDLSLTDVKTYDVRSGDSLWKIAKLHKPDHMNIQYYIDRLKELNGLTDSMLFEGMLLYIP